jgi:hypothetical protein
VTVLSSARPCAPRVVFIAGLGRSGSTLIERALGSMSGICAVGEVVHLWHRGVELNETCGCGEPFLACPFWAAVGAEAFGGWDNLDVVRVERLRKDIERTRFIPAVMAGGWRPAFATEVREYVGFYDRLYRAIATVAGTQTIVDSSKHPSLAFMLAAASDTDLRVLQVVRDPRAVAHAWTKRILRPEASPEVEDEMYTYRPARAAMLWTVHNASLSLLRGTPRLVVRFEDFVAAPRRTLREVATWCDVPDSADMPISEQGVARLEPAHTVSGNPVRHAAGAITIAPQEGWRAALPAAERRAVTALTLPLLGRFGYPVRVGSGDGPASTAS